MKRREIIFGAAMLLASTGFSRALAANNVGPLQPINNLADIDNPTTGRNNIGLYSVNVKQFGAKGDMVIVNGAVTVNATANAFTIAGASFTAADVGKIIVIHGAGASGYPLTTTIATVVDGTHITTAANAGTSVSAVAQQVYYGTNDSAAFNSAMAAVGTAGGGTVFVPDVKYGYVLGAQLNGAVHVNLQGSFNGVPWGGLFVSSVAVYAGGPTLAVCWGQGTTTGAAFMANVSGHGYPSGLNWLYPAQLDVTEITLGSPVAFPPSIAISATSGDGVVVSNRFVNSYQWMYFAYGHGGLYIADNFGPLIYNAITLNGGGAGDQLVNNVVGNGYGESNAAYYTSSDLFNTWMCQNAIGIDIGREDGIQFFDCNIGAGLYAIRFGAAPNPGGITGGLYAYGSWHGGLFDTGPTAIFVDGGASGGLNVSGFDFVGVKITVTASYAATAQNVIMQQATSSFPPNSEYRPSLTFTDCTFWGGESGGVNGTLTEALNANGGNVNFIGCTFLDVFQTATMEIVSGTPIISVVGCNFQNAGSSIPHFKVDASAGGRILQSENDFMGKQLNVSYGGSATAYVQGYNTLVVASAGTMTLPNYGALYYAVSGTTTITSITASGWAGQTVVLEFQGSLTVTDGSNLRLNGNLSASAGTTLTLACDGTNWYEQARSVN